MITVTDLTGYIYCSRALYLQKVLGIREPAKPAMIKGSIRHNVYDELNRAEEKIITAFGSHTPKQELFNTYKKEFAVLLRSNILKRREQMIILGLNPGELFLELWPYLLEESVERANNVFDFAEKQKVFGEKLWADIEPKIVTELSVKSKELMLKGIIDKIEVYKDKYVPYELKTGTAPKEGMWPGHRVQLAAYMLLLKHKFGIEISSGIVHYLDEKKKQELQMNPFIETEIQELTQKTIETLNSAELPSICSNPKKCLSCGLRHKCKNSVLLQAMIKTKHLNM